MKRLCALFLSVVLYAVTLAAGEPSDNSATVRTRFAWGAEIGSSIDLSANDMSSIDFNAGFGLSRGWMKFVGIGAEASIMVSNSCRTYPVFAMLRTDFCNTGRRLLFLDARGGVAFDYLQDNISQTNPYASLGVGINLAVGKTFCSHIIAGYTFIGRDDVVKEDRVIPYNCLHLACIRLGVTF